MELKLKLSNYFKQEETLAAGRGEWPCYHWGKVKGGSVCRLPGFSERQRVLMCGLNQRFRESLELHGHPGDHFYSIFLSWRDPGSWGVGRGAAMWTAEEHG